MDIETRDRILNSDKTLIIDLSGDNCLYNALTYKDFVLAIKEGRSYIVTPLTTAIDNGYCLQGYRVIVRSEGQERCLNDMLLGDIGENEKELRLSHNAEKLFLAGVYDNIETSWEQRV